MFMYEVIEDSVTFYDSIKAFFHEHLYRKRSRPININDLYPWLIFSTYKQYRLYVKTYYDEIIQIEMMISNNTSSNTSRDFIAVYDGPDTSDDLILFKGNLIEMVHSDGLNTSTFQAYIVLKLELVPTFPYVLQYVRNPALCYTYVRNPALCS